MPQAVRESAPRIPVRHRLGLAWRVVIALIAGTSSAHAQEIHSRLCLHGCPLGGAPDDDLVIRDIYILRSSPRTKFANWVAYRVTAVTIGPSQRRHWRTDPWLAPHKTLEPADYADAYSKLKVDRGHQAPLASFSATPQWEETNYLSNITPQKRDLNRGAWARLEAAVREIAQREDVEAVFVMTGPLFEKPTPNLPRTNKVHQIPSGYWKVIAVDTGDEILVAAFIMGQDTARGADMCQFIVSVSEVERRSRFDFFHRLSAEAQHQLEAGRGKLVPKLGCE